MAEIEIPDNGELDRYRDQKIMWFTEEDYKKAIREAKRDAWDEGSQATAEFLMVQMQAPPGPNGPSDPPANPYDSWAGVKARIPKAGDPM